MITGRVTDQDGDPVVAIQVTATTVPAPRGAGSRVRADFSSAFTDDRGIYRIYGLVGGKYLVRTSIGPSWMVGNIAYSGLASTYHPSSTVDTAAPVDVQAGSESAGVDIQFKGEAGHAVSGQVVDASGSGGSSVSRVSVTLYQENISAPVAFASTEGRDLKFEIDGIADGIYYAVAVRYGSHDAVPRSDPVRITAKGSDVTGVVLRISNQGSISGQVKVRPLDKPENHGCRPGLNGLPPEAELLATIESTGKTEPLPFEVAGEPTTAPDQDGKFKMVNLKQGMYHLGTRLPEGDWYLDSIVLEQAEARTSAARGPTPGGGLTSQPKGAPRSQNHGTDSARVASSFDISSGSEVKGLVLTLAQGAASIEGRAKAGDGKNPVSPTVVYLIPADPGSEKDPFRFIEAEAETNGHFEINHVPPGRYRLLTKAVQYDSEGDVRRLTWTAKGRQDLEQAAASGGKDVDLKQCQKFKMPW